MLTQTKVKLKKRSQRGSVLLMVVLSIMLLFTLTTICLDVINRSTRASSRNVQKTQAKITAESVLTEFIDGYKVGRKNEGISDEKIFQGLMDMAGTQASPRVIKVEMKDTAGAVNAERFGTSELRIYKVGTTALKVESVCTFGTMEQTASVIFKTVTVSPYVPSNTIESREGTLTTGYNEKQVSSGTDGNIYLENKDTAVKNAKSFSRQETTGHIYSEFSLRIDDQTKITDGTNKINKNIDSSGRVYKPYPDDDSIFQQASTVITENYFAVQNNFSMYTDVGKTDADGDVPAWDGGVQKNANYNADKLGNYDGFLLVQKKLLCTNMQMYEIGKADKPIDIYCRGAFFMALPLGQIGTKDFTTEVNGIVGANTNFPYKYGDIQVTSPSGHIYGNLYCYKADSPNNYNDGALVITHQCGTANTKEVVIDGDVFVDGNIYIQDGSKLVVQNGGTVTCTGTIFICNFGDYLIDKSSATGGGTTSLVKTYTIGSDGAVVGTIKDYICCKDGSLPTFKKTIDYTKKRNNFPSKGYDPSSAHESDERTTLSTLYGSASANDIFKTSIDGTDANLVAASQNLAAKYAEAMNHMITTSSPADPASSHPDYKYYQQMSKAFPGETVTVAGVGSDDHKWVIKKSVSLDQELAENGAFWIELGDDDIIIAMPIAVQGATDWDPATKGDNARFRIQRKSTTAKGFVYFMYYDPADKTKCLYYPKGESKEITDAAGKAYTITGDAGEKKASTDTDAGTSRGKIRMGSGSGNFNAGKGVMVGDVNAVTGDWATTKSDVFKETTEFDGAVTKNINNYIMYLVPDEVGFFFSEHNYNKTQGLVYAINSKVEWNIQTAGTEFLGQIKGREVKIYGDQTGYTVIKDCPMGNGSLLGYVGAMNDNKSAVKIQYFQY